MKEKMKILDLFSGIGGFSLGLESTGHFETTAFCEIDKFCKLILNKHWEGKKIYDDVKAISKKQFEEDGIELPDIITGGFPCQPFSVSQASNKEPVTVDISGQRCFESSKTLPRGGLLAKMLKALLTSKTAWCSDRSTMTWKEKVTKSGRSIFQLQVSKLPTDVSDSGLWLTPSASMRENRSEEAMKHRVEYRKSIGRTTVPPGNLAEQVQYGEPTTDMKMYPTPKERDYKGAEGKRVIETSTGYSKIRKGTKTKFGASLNDVAQHLDMKIWRTPDAHCNRGPSSVKRMKMKLEKGMPISLNDQVAHPNLMWPTPNARDLGRISQHSASVSRQDQGTYTEG